MPPLGHTPEQDAFYRANVARHQYINCRMQDLPAPYQALMPYTFVMPDLMEAEEAIRRMVEEDLKLLNSPWRRVGPVPTVLDDSDLSYEEKMAFWSDLDCPIGMTDTPKRGRESDPEVIRAMAGARQSPEYAAFILKLDLIDERQAAVEAYRSAPVEEKPAAGERITAIEEKITAIHEEFPRLKSSGFRWCVDRRPGSPTFNQQFATGKVPD